jgi:hypothetical protein
MGGEMGGVLSKKCSFFAHYFTPKIPYSNSSILVYQIKKIFLVGGRFKLIICPKFILLSYFGRFHLLIIFSFNLGSHSLS